MTEVKKTPYEVLRNINVNAHTEQKNGLTYLSWVWALDTLYMLYPETTWRINYDMNGMPYHTDGRTCWVDVEVFIAENGQIIQQRREPAFPVMDYRNKSIPLDEVTSMAVNTAIQRALTKCIARHGLGLYIYAGEDLPQVDADKQAAELIKEYQEIEAELNDLGIDRHNPDFVSWVITGAKVEGYATLDPAYITKNAADARKIMAQMRKAVKAKREKHDAR